MGGERWEGGDKHEHGLGIREAMDLGRKGAAFANLGDIAAGFLPEPFAESKDGVKLGESTLSPLLKVLLEAKLLAFGLQIAALCREAHVSMAREGEGSLAGS